MVALTSCSGNDSSVISPGTTSTLPPAALIASAVSLAGAGVRSQTTTDAPSAANSFAAAAPMPRPEPVRIATLPSNMPMLCLLLCLNQNPCQPRRVNVSTAQNGHDLLAWFDGHFACQHRRHRCRARWLHDE